MVSQGQGLGREHRLAYRKDIERVFRQGQRHDGQLFSFRVLPKEEAIPRVAVVVGRKVGKAVVRNRVRRAVREAFRKNKGLFAHWDVVVLPRPEAGRLTSRQLQERLIAEFTEVVYGQRDVADQRGLQDQESRA